MSSQYSLLPDNRSPLERGLELAFTELLTSTPSPFPDLLNAHKTARPMLPYLAQERGVVDWDPAAPESEQRLTVANAWPVRRLAGTKKGIELAIDSLEYDSEITPWHQMEPKGQPYTFEVIAWKRENAPINRDVVHRLEAHIDNAKSERDTYELYLAFGVSSSLAVSGAIDKPLNVPKAESFDGVIQGSPHLTGSFSFSGVQDQLVYSQEKATGVLPDFTACSASLSFAGACCLYVFTDFSPGAKL